MFDIVIPVYKPNKEFKIVLTRLLQQNAKADNIILINTEAEFFNEKEYLIDDRIKVIHIKKEEFDHANTRDMGMRMSEAEYVLFMTMDAVPKDKKLTECLLDSFKDMDEKVAVAYARQLPKKNSGLQERYTRSYNYPDESRIKSSKDIDELGIKTFFCSDVCAMYDRKVYLSNGGFRKNMIFNEDMIYAATAIKNGYSVYYCADAMVYHSHKYTCMEQFHRNFDLGVSQADNMDIFGEISSENEGIKMILSTTKYLVQNGHWYEVPYLFINSIAKYAGYLFGKNYKKLNKNTVKKMSLNKEYWEKMEV